MIRGSCRRYNDDDNIDDGATNAHLCVNTRIANLDSETSQGT